MRSNDFSGGDSPWSPLVQVLMRLKGSGARILFIANPGNAGDALIASATWQLFDRLGLCLVSGRTEDIRSGDAVIYGGGGNLVPAYPAARKAIEAAVEKNVGCFVLLPHTVRAHDELLRRLDERFVFFCRDLPGFDHVTTVSPRVDVKLCPDMALAIDVGLLQSRVKKLSVRIRAMSAILRTRRLRRFSGWIRATRELRPDQNGELLVMRSDVEAAGGPGDRSRDLSAFYGSALRSRDESDVISARFLEVIDQASTIRTDRLHVAIAGQILGKQVVLLDNSYGKNYSVVSAFRSFFPDVRLAS